VFVSGLQQPFSGPPAADLTTEPPPERDRVRHAELAVTESGRLEWASERPVPLTHTWSTREAGAAQWTKGRRMLRYYVPSGGSLTERTNRWR
jgi:hypothetical protein